MTVLTCIAFLAPADASATPDATAALSESRTLAAAGQYEPALALLNKAQKRDPDNVELHLGISRIYSWQGKIDEAQAELDKIPPDLRNNADVNLMQATLYYHRGHYERAAALYSSIIERYPEYADARDGLARVRRAQASPEPAHDWQLDTGLELSSFSRRRQDGWEQQFVQVSRLLNARTTVIHGKATRYNQFDNTDSEYELGVDQVFGRRGSAYLYTAVTPEADFRPELRVSTGGALRLDRPDDKGPALWLTLDTRRDLYADTKVININPGLRLEPVDGWALTGRIISVDQESEKRVYGREFRLDGTFTEDWRFTTGWADAPETVAGVTVDTRTIYGSIAVDVTPEQTLRIGYTKDDRDNSYIREVVNASVSHRF